MSLPPSYISGGIYLKKNPIVNVHYTYVGTAQDFEAFLRALVYDYLRVRHSDTFSKLDSMQKVESGEE